MLLTNNNWFFSDEELFLKSAFWLKQKPWTWMLLFRVNISAGPPKGPTQCHSKNIPVLSADPTESLPLAKAGCGESLGNMSLWGKWTHIIKYHSHVAFKWLQLFFEARLGCWGSSWEYWGGLIMSAWHLCSLTGDWKHCDLRNRHVLP